MTSSQVWSFRNMDDIVNDINLRLSNMAGGFPFECGGRVWTDSERLYLCGEWLNNTDEHRFIQECLLSYTSGFGAKRFGKAKFGNFIRPDFADFRKLLIQIPQDVILNVETNKINDIGGWKGQNNTGKALCYAVTTSEREQNHR